MPTYYTDYDDLPYVIQSEKLDRWGVPLTPTATRDAEIAKHARRAYSIINSKLARRYASHIPFTTVTLPDVVHSISLDLVIFFMAGAQQNVGEGYLRNYDNSIDLLQALSDGEIDLYDDNGDSLLTEFDSGYGFENNIEYDSDDPGEELRVFPDSLLQKPPSSYEKTTWEDT